MENLNDINIFLSSDENYSYPLGVCLVSILENNKNVFDNINFYILDNNMKKETIDKINSLKNNYNCNFFFYSINEIKNIFPKDIELNNTFKQLGYSTFGRLFIDKIIKTSKLDLDRILYLDCDIIVNKSLKKLYNIDIGDYYLAAVLDEASNELSYRLKKENKTKQVPYFNSGVLLINLKKWRLENIEDKFILILKEKIVNLEAADQDILNIALESKIKFIDLKYNVYPEVFYVSYEKLLKLKDIIPDDYYPTKDEYDNASKNPVIIHYYGAGGFAPFKENCLHPEKYKFEYYKNISPWKNSLHLKSNHSVVFLKLSRIIINYTPTLVVRYLFKYYKKLMN